MATRDVVVVGAGVVGLTTALLLAKTGRFTITVAAKHMPGDYDIEYASPWAGAAVTPLSLEGSETAVWEAKTWKALQHLAKNHPEAGIHFQECNAYHREKDQGSPTADWFAGLTAADPWWKSLFSDFRRVPKSELRPDITHANRFTSVCVNTAIYLPWLVSQCLALGVNFKRARFESIQDASAPGVHHSGRRAGMVINCTGLGSRKLKGVEDKSLYAARAQIVHVRNEADAMHFISGTDDGADETMYVMKRAAGGGTILGGCYQRDNWESQPDPNLATRIMKRAIEACPELTNGKGIEGLDVIRHGVGLRPARDGGARVESEKIGDTWVVHNYGHGGSGYQWSYGSAEAAVKLANETGSSKPRL